MEDGATVGFHNFNLRIFNLRVSNPNKLIVDVFFDTMSDFNVPGSRPSKNTMKFRKSTVFTHVPALAIMLRSADTYALTCKYPFVYTINAKIFQGLGPKRRESCDGDQVLPYYY